MDALTALHSRVSVSRLTDPAPDQQALDNMFRAAMRAPDHGLLRPWRFLVLRESGRERLAELFVQASLLDEPDLAPQKVDKIRSKPLRAPMIIVGICSPKDHPKVPVFEQQLAAGAAIDNLLIAAHAQHIGAMWRTGPMASHATVTHGLGLEKQESILGFVYLGTPDGPIRPLTQEDFTPYIQDW
ncbi:nitroreductase [Pseudohongiella acticola]|jgi:nitroreductase|uniref:Putative NAD(P)H nitroreductase n=1 Tax=Pseudohongiella acticola TaxID=1524254 RepID=A0A1E8CH79_9GAMM|nr:nitroreductase [Pseudohongiella acticola]OFE11597.1 nitroreductase [Pseudohongiella acticola]